MIAVYPSPGSVKFQVAAGSTGVVDPEARILWILEPGNVLRGFSKVHELDVPEGIASAILEEKFHIAFDAVNSPLPATPFEILPKPERYRKYHHRVKFYGAYDAAVPVGSRFKVTARGVAVALPNGGLKLYGPRSRILLTPGEEASLLAQIPKHRKSY